MIPIAAKRTRTPAQIMADMILCAMQYRGETRQSMAKKLNVAVNTVCSDMHDPDRIPQNRLWLYFTVLDIPVQDVLSGVAHSFADTLARR